MYRFVLSAMILSAILFASSEVSHITRFGQDYTVIEEDYDEYDSKGRSVKFYRDANNYDLKFLFAFTLTDKTGTCGERSIEEGAYEIEGDKLTLYTRWDREGKAYLAPKGVRVMRYRFERDGTLRLESAQLYIETKRKALTSPNEGLYYLFHTPKNASQKKRLQAYIDRIERTYRATFVLGKAKARLEAEVEEALRRKNRSKWR